MLSEKFWQPTKLFGKHLALFHSVKMSTGTVKKKTKNQDLSTYSNCSRKVPRCFALGFHMKTSESVRICIGVFSRLFESSWTGTNCLILHFVCSLPACTHCHRRKAEQIRQQTLSLLTHAVKPCSQVLLAGSQSTDTEINKPQQFGFMLKFQHCILIFFFFFAVLFFPSLLEHVCPNPRQCAVLSPESEQRVPSTETHIFLSCCQPTCNTLSKGTKIQKNIGHLRLHHPCFNRQNLRVGLAQWEEGDLFSRL